jgi:hypothetical protein
LFFYCLITASFVVFNILNRQVYFQQERAINF